LANDKGSAQNLRKSSGLFPTELNQTATRIRVIFFKDCQLSFTISSRHNTNPTPVRGHHVIPCSDAWKLSSFYLYGHALKRSSAASFRI
jgi:hypothetical protein